MEEIITELEEWRHINGHSKYQVSNIGRVRNARSGKILKPAINRCGYEHLNLTIDGIIKDYSVHRLVALEFIPNPNNKTTVDHIDSTAKLNNTTDNLRWATQKEQCRNISAHSNTSSQYKGVSWNKFHSRWTAYITRNVKQKHLGYFESEEEAALTYNKEATEHFGEFAKLNVIQLVVV